MCAAILTLEAISVGLVTPVMINLEDVEPGPAIGIGLGVAAACLLTAGLLRAEWAYGLGWVVQGAAVALGFIVPIMFLIGGLFGGLYATAYFLGRKIERDRAAAYAEYDGD
jgi:hypothetical protein